MNEEGNLDRAKVKVFPPGVPLLTIVAGVVLQRFVPLPAPTVPEPLRYWIGGALVSAIVLVLGLWPVVLFRRSGQSENPWKPTPQIVERGPFRFTRNPMYLQMVLVCVAVAWILSNIWILILTPVGGWVLQRFAIGPEEEYLEGKFGAPYVDYKQRVRRWL